MNTYCYYFTASLKHLLSKKDIEVKYSLIIWFISLKPEAESRLQLFSLRQIHKSHKDTKSNNTVLKIKN